MAKVRAYMTWVMLPGMDGTGEVLAPLAHALSNSDLAVVVRYPRVRSLTWRELIATIDESLPVTEDYVLFAESFSGPLAIEIASRNPRPKRLRGLVLCASFAKPPMPPGLRFLLRVFGGALVRIPPPAFVVRRYLIGPDASDSDVAIVQSSIRSVSGGVLAERLKIVCTVDSSKRLARAAAPTVVIGARGDKLVARSVTDDLANGISHAKLEWIDGPHLLAFTRPKQVLAATQAFLNLSP